MTPDDKQPGMAKPELTSEQIEREGSSFGNRFLLEPAPDNALPKTGMPAQDAMRLVGEEILLDGLPMRQSRDVRDHLDGARGHTADHRRPAHQTSSITPSTRRRPRSSSAASACSPTSSMPPARRPARARRAPPRRSCSARCH